jgi:hypothetical protein
MKTTVAATLLALSAASVAAQSTFYSPGGDYLGQGTRHRNTTTFYDASGSLWEVLSPSGVRPVSLVAMAPFRSP